MPAMASQSAPAPTATPNAAAPAAQGSGGASSQQTAASLPGGIEIFRAGTHRDDAGNTHSFSRAQLEEMAATYNAALRERGFAALISGAGPTVLTLANGTQEAERVISAIEEITSDPESEAHTHNSADVSWRVMALRVPAEGAKVGVSTQ